MMVTMTRKHQADYILGNNPADMSYLVGYEAKYPLHVHHRGTSIASIFSLHSEVGCTQGFELWYNRAESNPNVICGAFVGGPDKNDGFSDDRSNYEQTEPTLSASAPLVDIFAKLQSLYCNIGEGYNHNESPMPQQKTQRYNQDESQVPQHKTPSTYTGKETASKTSEGVPVQFLLSISSTWTVGGATYYRHRLFMGSLFNRRKGHL
ncbi:endoglucanase 2 isoform X3 [Vigna angularis]|uniref:endoglucanase 2 isoform X3 n=1 Tax=Phaseolus angularis TaxID=3914 RepID=UPI00080A3E8F|nr:endoglucanase 2 isoform X3 [Vigna angularis]